MKKLLLHTCCAPCGIACIKSLREENIEPHLFWYNPNIHPYLEYKARRDCLKEFAGSEKLALTVFNKEYDLCSFLEKTFPVTEKRCKTCYSIRLEKTASFAAQEGFSSFTTTLLISPYQDHGAIKQIGEALAKKYSIEFLYRDFRPIFREGQILSRANGFYMQKYCGCIFSEEERYLKSRNKKEFTPDVSHSVFERLKLLTGEQGLIKLSKAGVLVFGAGGVGSWAAEALVRSGIGKLGIIDNDKVCASNVNRQLEATMQTIGMPKALALKKRLLEINPQCEITAYDELFCRENSNRFGIENACYVIDAIDSVNHKLDLIEITINAGVTLFSSMGMALKTDPSKIKAASIWKTDVCPLARLVRSGLRKRKFEGDFTAVFSAEAAKKQFSDSDSVSGHSVNGSIVTVTGTAGLQLASLVINNILNCEYD